MRNTPKLSFIIILFLISAKSSAQKIIIPYQKVYFGDGKNKPFDKEFDLMMPFNKKDTIYDVFLYKHRGNKTFAKSLDKEPDGEIRAIRLNNNWEKINDTDYLKVEMRYKEAVKKPFNAKKPFARRKDPYSLLKPSRSYSLIITNGLTAEAAKIIDALRTEYNASGGTISSNGTAYAEYVNQRERQRKKNKIVTLDPSFPAYINFYDSLRRLEDSLSKYQIIDSTVIVSCTGERLFDDDCIGDLLRSFNGDGCLKTPVKCVDTCNLLRLILSLQKLTCDNKAYFVQGKATLANIGLVKDYPKWEKYLIRRSNTDLNLSDLLKLKNVIQQVLFQLTGSNCEDYIRCLQRMEQTITGLIDEVSTVSTNINNVLKYREEIDAFPIASELFIDYEIAGMNTYIYNFQARNEMAITPVFGYAYYGFQKDFGGFTPYLGFQVNFQGVNRDDLFHQIKRKTIWQRLCFTTAWTLTEIKEDKKRDDLFDKSSLITALGFKLSHIVMINAGGLWFKKEDPNPIVTDKKIAVTPVVALSLNLEVDRFLNGFTKLIPKK